MTCKKKLTDLHEESGQALVEFALVLMFVILPFTFVLIDGAMTLFSQAAITNAAREGARAGSISLGPEPLVTQTFAQQVAAADAERAADVQAEAQRLISPLLWFPSCTTTITYSPGTPVLGNPSREFDSINVRLSCPRRLFFGLAGAYEIMLEAQSTMQIEPAAVKTGP
ncbi:MAG TPA: TadE family protein [Anaerolineae bacterium]|nr:TadE family protein [Anaerolineae bacterium]